MANYKQLTQQLRKIMGDADYQKKLEQAYDICLALQQAGYLKRGRKKTELEAQIIMKIIHPKEQQ